MKDEQVINALTAKAITLRISGGSQEAQYLAAYYPLPVLPAFLIISNGQLVLDLRAREERNQFKATILRCLSSTLSQPQRTSLSPTLSSETSMTQPTPHHTVPQASAHAATSTSAPSCSVRSERSNPTTNPSLAALAPPSLQSSTLNPNTDTLSSTARSTAHHANVPSSRSQDDELTDTVSLNATRSIAPPSASPGGQTSQTVQSLLADRRRKLELDKNAKEAAEKAERKAKAEARNEAIFVAPDSAKAKQATYAAQQKKRQHEAKQDRERILRQIEHDKADRKEREERRKAIARAEAEVTDGASGLVDQQLASEVNFSRSMRFQECALQVRLFDGSTVRSRFLFDQTLRGSVRPWIDQHKLDDIPYTFKQVSTPMPNRNLSISDEEATLQSLGLTPSATLVTIPVQGYTTAYSGGQSIVSKGASAGYRIASAGAGIVTGALGAFLGLGSAPDIPPDTHDKAVQRHPEAEVTRTGSGINVRTLRDQRNIQDDHQLYNGNQVLCPIGCSLVFRANFRS